MGLNNKSIILKRNRLIAYGLLMISPFLSFGIAVRNWKTDYAKNILIGVIVFIGMTAFPEGDLERYQNYYYYNASQSFEMMWHNLISLKEGKFYITFFSFLFGLIFQHHNIYMGFLFFLFGYYLVNFIFLIYNYDKSIVHQRIGFLIFISFALFFSLRNAVNLAFYTGAIYILYWIVKSILTQNNKFLIPLLLAPLFHFALTLVLIPVMLFVLLKSRTFICIALVVVSYMLPPSIVNNTLGDLANDNESTIIEDRYNNYASEKGIEYMNKRYEKGASNANFKLKLLNDIKNIIFDNVIYIGLFLFLIFFKRYKNNKLLIQFFNMILLFWAISNLMMNVSNGNRYQIFQITLGVVFFVLLYQTKIKNRIMNAYFFILFPLVFLYGLMNLYATNKMISTNFFVSNFFVEIISPSEVSSELK